MDKLDAVLHASTFLTTTCCCLNSLTQLSDHIPASNIFHCFTAEWHVQINVAEWSRATINSCWKEISSQSDYSQRQWITQLQDFAIRRRAVNVTTWCSGASSAARLGKWDFTFNVLSPWKRGRLRDESHLQRQVQFLAADLSLALYHSEPRETGREGGDETPREKKAERVGKRGVCSQADFVGECFLPRFLTQGRRWLAAGCGTDWARAEAALYACQGCAAPDQCKEPNEGQVQQTACGYGARSQAFNYSHVGCGAAFFFMFRWLH